MPIVSSHRTGASSKYLTGGTQYINDQLVLPPSGSTTFYLSPTIFTRPGSYVLFDYLGSANPTPISGSLSSISIDLTGFNTALFSGTYSITDVTGEKKVILTLFTNANAGTQYVNGELTINSSVTLYLSSTLYNTAGTYILFDWSGGGSFTGSVSNLFIVPPPGRAVDTGVSSNGCAISGSTITVTLI